MNRINKIFHLYKSKLSINVKHCSQLFCILYKAADMKLNLYNNLLLRTFNLTKMTF